MKLLLSISLFIFSCSSRESCKFSNANKIEITYYNNGDTLKADTVTQMLAVDVKKVLDKKAVITTCLPTGRIVFYKDEIVVYSLDFSTDATGAANECQYLMLKNKGWKLTYQVGMYLDEEFYSLKKKNE